MKVQITIIFLAVLLATCTPSQSIPVDAQNTAMVAVQTYIALTQTALPTPTVIPTATPEATLLPTLPPPPIFTPDAVQVERWQEYLPLPLQEDHIMPKHIVFVRNDLRYPIHIKLNRAK